MSDGEYLNLVMGRIHFGLVMSDAIDRSRTCVSIMI